MKPPVSIESSLPPAPSRKGDSSRVRILVVAGEENEGVVQSLRQWAEDAALQVEGAPDLPRAVRKLAAERWDLVVAVLSERADDDLAWWVDALRGASGAPRLIAATDNPSMGLVLRAESLGVLDLLTLPLRKDDFLGALALSADGKSLYVGAVLDDAVATFSLAP